MTYLYNNLGELDKAKTIRVHATESFFPNEQLPVSYVKGLIDKEPIKATDYYEIVNEMTKRVTGDYSNFSRLALLTQLLFATYELKDDVLHLYSDKFSWYYAYESIRERLDEIVLSN